MTSKYYTEDESGPRPQGGTINVDRPERVNLSRAVGDAKNVKTFKPYDIDTPYTGGKVKALFVGINYTGTANQLDGCVNDVRTIMSMLEAIDFPIQEAAVLVDDTTFPNVSDKPTRANMIRYMAWLTEGAKSGDVLFLHYSGHGAQAKATKDSQEAYDQCLVPLQYEKDGTILDDDLFLELVKPLPDGVRMTVVFDCCHSASMLDLPFQFVGSSSVTETGSYKMDQVRQDNFSAADVLLFSGCADEGTSADVKYASGAGGAATAAFTWCVENEHGANYMDVIVKTREALVNKGFTQVPQLSCSKPLDLSKPFSLFGDLTVDEKQFEEQVPEDFRKEHPIKHRPQDDKIPPRFRHHLMHGYDADVFKNGFVPPERRGRRPPFWGGGMPPPGGHGGGRGGGPGMDRGGRGGPDMDRGGRGGPDMDRGGRGGPDMDRGGRGGPDMDRGGRGGPDMDRGGRGGPDMDRGGRGGPDMGSRGISERGMEHGGGHGGPGMERGGHGGPEMDRGGRGGGPGMERGGGHGGGRGGGGRGGW